MNQIGYEKEWLHFLDMYVRPLQEAAYAGYFQKVKINTEYLNFYDKEIISTMFVLDDIDIEQCFFSLRKQS